MKRERDILRHIEALLGPKHLFILPEWADPLLLDRLLKEGHLTCRYLQRDERGTIHLVMGLQITESGLHLLHPLFDWSRLSTKMALGGTSMLAISLIILYLG